LGSNLLPNIIMSSVADGYLGLNIDGSSPIVAGISLSLMAVCLISQCVIAVYGYRHMVNKDQFHGQFKCLFMFCFACCSTMVIGVMIETVMVMVSYSNPIAETILRCVQVMGIFYFWSCLLTILVMRLHVTFGSSLFKMTKTTEYVFGCILVLLFVLPLVLPVLRVIATDYNDHTASSSSDDFPDWYLSVALTLFLVYFAMFFVGSVLAVYHFINNLRLLAKAQAISPKAPDIAGNEISLDENQQKLSDLAARYLLLFGVAIFSDIFFTVGLGLGFSISSRIRDVFGAADLTINFLCVYLQFAFAKEHYRRCCGCLDRLCRNKISSKTRTMMSRHHAAQMTAQNPQMNIVVSSAQSSDKPQKDTVKISAEK